MGINCESFLYSLHNKNAKGNPERAVTTASKRLAEAPKAEKTDGYTRKSFEITELEIKNTISVLLNLVEVSNVSPYLICVFLTGVFVLSVLFAHFLVFLNVCLFHIGFTNNLP